MQLTYSVHPLAILSTGKIRSRLPQRIPGKIGSTVTISCNGTDAGAESGRPLRA